MCGEYDDDAGPKLGPCCMCQSTEDVRNIVMLSQRGPTPGFGWGCVSCGLPLDGAMAVLCDRCLPLWEQDHSRVQFACKGSIVGTERIGMHELPAGEFDHAADCPGRGLPGPGSVGC